MKTEAIINQILEHPENQEILTFIKNRQSLFYYKYATEKNEASTKGKELTHPSLLEFIKECTQHLHVPDPITLYSYDCFYCENRAIFLVCIGAEIILLRKNLKYYQIENYYLSNILDIDLNKWHEMNPWFSGLEEKWNIKMLKEYFEKSYNFTKKL